jgi:hypothetical protein
MNGIVAILLMWAASVTVQGEAPKPVRIVGPGYEGAIISGEAQLASDPRHVLKPTQVWTPAEDDVREAVKLLPEYLTSPEAASVLRGSRIKAELPRYKRQYWGVAVCGPREILIHFYHEDSSVGTRGLWLRGIVAVAGGGDKFFRVSYQVQRRHFTKLQINAPESRPCAA